MHTSVGRDDRSGQWLRFGPADLADLFLEMPKNHPLPDGMRHHPGGDIQRVRQVNLMSARCGGARRHWGSPRSASIHQSRIRSHVQSNRTHLAEYHLGRFRQGPHFAGSARRPFRILVAAHAVVWPDYGCAGRSDFVDSISWSVYAAPLPCNAQTSISPKRWPPLSTVHGSGCCCNHMVRPRGVARRSCRTPYDSASSCRVHPR